MRTEAVIREKISFLSGYLNAGLVYGMPDKEAKTIKAVNMSVSIIHRVKVFFIDLYLSKI